MHVIRLVSVLIFLDAGSFRKKSCHLFTKWIIITQIIDNLLYSEYLIKPYGQISNWFLTGRNDGIFQPTNASFWFSSGGWQPSVGLSDQS
jgi:hypothetical protein